MSQTASPYQFLLPPQTPARGNVTAYVTEALRNAIVSLEFAPGTMLDKGAICDRLGVSRFPVSEALARLQAEGLVDILPQRGTTVSLVRIADVLEYMVIRKALESEAVRIVVGNPPAGLVAALQENMALQRQAAEADDGDGFHRVDLAFHHLILDAQRFIKIRGVIESARANLDRARRLIMNPRRLTVTIAEHQAILDGIIASDPGAAAAALRHHIDTVMVELIAFARRHPDLFADGQQMLDTPGYDSFPFG